ncbi:STAS domain-containing protein [Motilibacter aurantiacus]|uniref:STAS domain-containing protein n=1 Tax=Motilibacter aurantiacus TaxID=2714955 RepID=UPI00140B07C1|nr:STAS domain-containing protein [Motilibacter aurantiacus]NHC47192.1 STAS domain-containing protein [Motilibacter aurantiacus]
MTVPEPGLTVVATTEHDVPVLSVSGELEAAGAPVLRGAVTDALAQRARGLVIDLRGVGFVDSAGLGVLVGALKRCRERGGELAVVSTTPMFLRTLRVTGLARILPTFPVRSEALGHVRARLAAGPATGGAEPSRAVTLPCPRWANRRTRPAVPTGAARRRDMAPAS